MSPQEFIAKWGPGGPSHFLNEEQGAQSHFLDLCELLGVSKPGTVSGYRFEERGEVIGGHSGYADVFMRNHFAWENKAPGKNLDAALKQLLTYSLALENPPLLVVCDRINLRIHTQFNGHPSETHVFHLTEFDQPETLAVLRRLWTNPESFRPRKTTRDITDAAARSFATLAEQLRKRGHEAEEVAHFLTQCLFCFFAEDVGLLPGRMFERLVNNKQLTTEMLTRGLSGLFSVMRDGGLYGPDHIPWFNGGLFQKIAVPKLEILDITELRNAAALNWSAIDVSIFGTLFERGLDPSKRSQLGAHYTDPATIMRIIDPVVRLPLAAAWSKTQGQISLLMARSKSKRRGAYSVAGRHYKASAGDAAYQKAERLFQAWLAELKSWRVLDPACGSGNFLFLALKVLKDLEHKSHLDAAALGLDRQQDLVTGPDNVLGIELNEYAAELARVTVWIGELQWRIEHGYEFKTNPVLEPLDHIECRDALLIPDSARGGFAEAAWPDATVVIGNPPFLGDKKMRAELGNAYTETLRKVYEGRVPGGADLVCYWFEKAREAIATGKLKAAGLVSTNSIRGGRNREVLDLICKTTTIFEAWSDEAWVNEGAAVRVSEIAFGNSDQRPRLDGAEVAFVNADLSATAQGNGFQLAGKLSANAGACLLGVQQNGPFTISGSTAREWLSQPSIGLPISKVLRPWSNGKDVTDRSSDTWIIDFGLGASERDAALAEKPFAYLAEFVRPMRLAGRRESRKKYWWRLGEPSPALRRALNPLVRYLATPRVSKHRVWVQLPVEVLPDIQLVVVARSDDSTYGVLSSRFHSLWAVRMGSSLEDRPRYTPTTCFETFPFPQGLTPADTAHQQTEILPGGGVIPANLVPSARTAAVAIARSAKRLHDLRELWLNPVEWTLKVPEVVPVGMDKTPYPDRTCAKPGFEKVLSKRTLTSLYNERPAWLASAQEELDMAVATAYGWLDYTPAMKEETILGRLLSLNRDRCVKVP